VAKALVQKVSGESAVDQLRKKVQDIFARHALKDARDVDSMNKYADYSADELQELVQAPIEMLKEKGLSRRAARIALYALLPSKEVPFAVKALHERSLARIRRVDDAQGLVALGFAIGQLPPRAPRRDDSEVITVVATEVK
jgi:hypothetical protein